MYYIFGNIETSDCIMPEKERNVLKINFSKNKFIVHEKQTISLIIIKNICIENAPVVSEKGYISISYFHVITLLFLPLM